MWQATVFDCFKMMYSYIILNDKHISLATKSEDFLLAQQNNEWSQWNAMWHNEKKKKHSIRVRSRLKF